MFIGYISNAVPKAKPRAKIDSDLVILVSLDLVRDIHGAKHTAKTIISQNWGRFSIYDSSAVLITVYILEAEL